MKGKFITFEGSEGCGKSTQSRMLYEYLKKKGRRVIYLREPGGTLVSEKIRKILLDSKNNSITPVCEMLLYMASRAQAVSEIIKPALIKGRVVICDRFLDSTMAYQGFGLGLRLDYIRRIGEFVSQAIMPDLTIFLDLAVKEGLLNRKSFQDRIEQRGFAYHLRVRKGYLKLAKQEPERIKVVKVQDDKFATQARIRRLAEDVI